MTFVSFLICEMRMTSTSAHGLWINRRVSVKPCYSSIHIRQARTAACGCALESHEATVNPWEQN